MIKVLLYLRGYEDSPIELDIRSFGDIDDNIRDMRNVIRIEVIQ